MYDYNYILEQGGSFYDAEETDYNSRHVSIFELW